MNKFIVLLKNQSNAAVYRRLSIAFAHRLVLAAFICCLIDAAFSLHNHLVIADIASCVEGGDFGQDIDDMMETREMRKDLFFFNFLFNLILNPKTSPKSQIHFL